MSFFGCILPTLIVYILQLLAMSNIVCCCIIH